VYRDDPQSFSFLIFHRQIASKSSSKDFRAHQEPAGIAHAYFGKYLTYWMLAIIFWLSFSKRTIS